MTDPLKDPTNGPLSPMYDRADVELFDLNTITHTSDQRSVGELLFDVDRQARLLLMDVSEHDAGPLLHAWPTLISSASSMWHAIPAPLPTPLLEWVPAPSPAPSPTPSRAAARGAQPATCMDRLEVISVGVSHRLSTKRWPGPDVPDQRIMEMADTLSRAADLTRRFAHVGPLSAAGRDDLEAARARLLHSIYLATHAVSVALLQHGRNQHAAAAATPRPLAAPGERIPYAVAPVTEWVRRIGAAEAAAASFVSRRQFTHLLIGEHHPAPTSVGRLNLALARWDVEAHRALAGPDWHDNVVLVTRTQAFIAGSAMTLMETAREQVGFPGRLVEAIGRSGAAWSDLGCRWDELTPAHARPAEVLVLAAAELRGAARELTHDGATRASSPEILARPGASEGLRALLVSLRHCDELAHVVDEKSTAAGLTGPARVMSRRAHNDIDAGRVPIALDENAIWVSPADILAKRIVPAPVAVILALQASSHTVVQAATAAGAIATATGDLLSSSVTCTRGDEDSATRPTAPLGDARTIPAQTPTASTPHRTGQSWPR
ncbi:hypothetical protein J2X46_003147 [Nocardioides sp. BE266]|uniref:hypothetical protein n=1 Tax=Nocardioides sp. BE266 TaxID=2817725 RepID=UPI00286493D6|nr:hypothetical protein [Nocardioides sp. BE266]MDR7254154.1 hypothetical protein [Nocardioides sp. BE266]